LLRAWLGELLPRRLRKRRLLPPTVLRVSHQGAWLQMPSEEVHRILLARLEQAWKTWGANLSLKLGIGETATQQAARDVTAERLSNAIDTGGPTGSKKVIAAAEISGPEYTGSLMLRSRSGTSTPLEKDQLVPHPPLPEEPRYHTFELHIEGQHGGERAYDAETRLMSAIGNVQGGTVDIATTKGMCLSCSHVTFQFQGDNPGVTFSLFAPPSDSLRHLDLGPLFPLSPIWPRQVLRKQ
jgi:hypothetical protein